MSSEFDHTFVHLPYHPDNYNFRQIYTCSFICYRKVSAQIRTYTQIYLRSSMIVLCCISIYATAAVVMSVSLDGDIIVVTNGYAARFGPLAEA